MSRQKTLGCFCCPPNVARTVAQSSRYAYATSERGVYVVLYGSSMLKTDAIALTQEANYPWDGGVRITIDQAQAGESSIYLRIPGWSNEAMVRVNGRPVAGPAERAAFLEIRRAWAKGDVIDLDLPMPVRLLEANPYVEESRNHVAVQRGPLVYCLESMDLPAGVRVTDVRVPRDVQLSPRATKELGGATVLEGRGLAIERKGWGNELYHDFSSAPPREFHLILVPYFAWDNRGEGEMTVWLPLA
jgi:DUF1680 family protein